MKIRPLSVHSLALCWQLSQQLFNRLQHSLSHRVAVQVALLQHRVGAHRGMDRRVFPVVLQPAPAVWSVNIL
jgi:hypothetical protein